MDDKNAITKITRDLLLKSKLNSNVSKQTQVFVIPPELLKGLIPENKKIKADISTKILLDSAKTNDTPKIRKSIINKNKNNEDDSESKKEDFSLKDHSNFKTDINVNEIIKIGSTFEKHESGELDINRVSDGNVLKDSDYRTQTKSVENNAITEVIYSKDSEKDNQDHKEKEFVRYGKVRKKVASHEKQENQYIGTKQLQTDSDIKTYNEVLTSSSVQHVQISFHVIEESDKETSNNFLSLKDTEPNSQRNSCKILSNNEKLATDNITKNVEEELLIFRKEMNPNTDISDDNQLSSILLEKQPQEHKVYNEVSATDTTNNKKDILKDNKVSPSHSEKQQQAHQVYNEISATDTTDNKIGILKDNKVSSNHSENQQQEYEVFDEVSATDTTDNIKGILKDNKVSPNHSEKQQQEHKVFDKISARDTTDDKEGISKDNKLSSNHSEKPKQELQIYNEVSATDITDNKKDNNESVKFSSKEMDDDCYEMEVTEEIEYIIEEILEIEKPMESQEMSIEMYTDNQNDYENRSESQKNACFNSKSYVHEESYSDDIALIHKKQTKPINVYVNKKKFNNQRKNDNFSTRFCTKNSITLPHNIIIDNSLTEKSNSKLTNKNKSSSEIRTLKDKGTVIKKEASLTEQNNKKLLKSKHQRKSIHNFNLDKVETIKTRLPSGSINFNSVQPIKLEDLSYLKTIHEDSVIFQNEVTCESNDTSENIKSFIGNKINENIVNEQTYNEMETIIFKGNHVLASEKFTDRSFENINLTDVIDNNVCIKNKDERSTENDQIFENQPQSYGFYEDSSLLMISEKSEEKKNHFAGSETIINTERVTETTIDKEHITEINKIDKDKEDSNINKNDETLEYEQQSYRFYEDNNSLSIGSETSEEKNNDFADSEIIVNTDRIIETTIETEHIIETNKSEDRVESNITKTDEVFKNQQQSYGFYKDNSLSMKSEKFVKTDKVKDVQKNNNKISSSLIKIKSNEKITREEVQNIFDKFKKKVSKDNYFKSDSKFDKLNTCNENNVGEKICSDNGELQLETQVVTKLNTNIMSNNQMLEQNVLQNTHPIISYCTKEKSLKKSESILNIESQLFKSRRKSTTDLIHKKTESPRTRTESLNLDDKKSKTLLNYYHLNAQQLNNNEKFEVKKISNSPSNKILPSQGKLEKEDNKPRSTSNKIIDNLQYDDKREDQEFEYLKIRNNKYDSVLESNEFNNVTVQQNSNTFTKLMVKGIFNENIDVSQDEKKESKDHDVSHLNDINLEASESRRRGRPPKLSKTITTKNQSIKKDNDQNKILEKLLRAAPSQTNNAYKEEAKADHLVAVNVQKRKRGRPPKGTKRNNNSNMEVKDSVISQEEEKQTANIKSIQESLSKTEIDTSEITNHVHEDMKKDIREVNSGIIKRKGRRSKSKVSNTIFSANISTTEITTDESIKNLHNNSVVAENIDFSIAHNNENLSHKDSHNLRKKWRGRPRSLKKLIPDLLSTERHNQIEKPDNKEESLDLKNTNNLLDFDNLQKTIEVNSPLNCNNLEMAYEECIKSSKDFHSNLSRKDKVDSSVACNNENLSHEDSHNLHKKRRGRPRSLKKLIPDLLSTERHNQIEKPDNKEESLDLKNTSNLLDSDNSRKTIEVNSPLNCNNLEMAYDECIKSSKDFHSNLSTKDKVDSSVACNNENLSHEDSHNLHKKRRGRPRRLKKLIPDLLSTERHNQIEKPDNKEESLDLNNTNNLLDSDNSRKTIEISSPLNCNNLEMAYDGCIKSSKDFHSNLSTKDKVDSSVACNNENLSHEDSHNLHKKRRGRPRSLKKLIPDLLSTERHNQIEKPDNKEESLDLNNTNNLLDSDNSRKTIEINSPLNCNNLEMAYDGCIKSSKDFHSNLSTKDKVDSSVACNNENLSHEDSHNLHKKRRGRPRSLEKLIPDLLSTERHNQIEKPDNKEESLDLNNTNNLLDSDNSQKNIQVNSPLNCNNLEMAYEECIKSSKDFHSNLSAKDKDDSSVACNNEILIHEELYKVHQKRRGKPPARKKEKSVLLRTEGQGHTEESDNKKQSLNLNSTNDLLRSDNLEITTNETDESSKALHYNISEESKIDYGIACSSEDISHEKPQGVHKKRGGKPPSMKTLKQTLLSTDREPIDNPVTDNNEELLALKRANNPLNSDNLEMTIDEADKSRRDLYNNSSIQKQIDLSIAYNNENLNYDDSNSSNNRRKSRSSSLEKSRPVLLSEKKLSLIEKSDNKEESFDFNSTSNLLNSDNIKLDVDEAGKLDLDTVHNRGKSRSPSTENLCPVLLNTEKQSPVEKLDDEKGLLNLNGANNLLNSDNFEKITDECNKSSKNVQNNLPTEDKIDSNTTCNNELLSNEDSRNTRKKRRGRSSSLKKSNSILLSTEKQNPIDNKEESLEFNITSKLLNSDNIKMAVDEAGKSDKDLRDNTPGESKISFDFRTACNDVNTSYEEPQSTHKKMRGRPPSAKKLKRTLLSIDRQPVDNPDNIEELLGFHSVNNLLHYDNLESSIEKSDNKEEFLDFNCTNNLLNSDNIEMAVDEAGKSDLDTVSNKRKRRSPISEKLGPVLLNTEKQNPIEKLDGGPLNLNNANNLLNSDNLEKITDECNKSSKHVYNNLPTEDDIDSNTTCNNEMLSNEDQHSTRKKRRGRPPSLRKSNPVLLSPEKQSSIENPDNKVESLELNISTKRRGRRRLKTEVSNFNPPSEKLENVATGQNVKSSSVSINKDDLEYEATTKNDSHEKTSTLECEPPKRRTRRSKLIDYFSDNKLNENATSNDMNINVATPVRLRKRKRNTDIASNELDDVKLGGKGNLDTEKGLSDEDESNNDDEKYASTKTRSRKRKCHFNIYRERKRGRPKGTQSKRKRDDDYVPHHSQLPRSSKKANTKLNTSAERTVKKMIFCGKCKKEMMKNQWSHHNLSSHNNLGWIEGTPKPDYENDEKLLKRLLFITIKKRRGSLICETCNSLKRSVLGFLSHITFCGKDDDEKQALMVTCPVCKAVTKPSSLEYHERLHKAQAEEKQKLALLEAEDSGLKTKRKAAEKAVTKISEFTALVKDDKIIVPADKKSKPHIVLIKKLIQKPQLTKRIPNTVIGKWKKDLDIGKKPMCSQVGCHFVCESLDEIKLHYSTCNFTPQENFVCKICQFKSSSEDEILNHAIQKHSAEDDDDVNLSMSDIESSNSDNNSDIENTNDKNKGLIKRFFFRERSEYAHKMFRFLFRDGACHTKYNRTFSPAFQWTLEFEHKNYKFDLFKEYIPNAFELLSAQESKMYLPELDQSMMMKAIKVGYRDSPESVWKKWKRFEGQCVLEIPTFFVGGPVWALAWLPIPSTLAFSENVSQFIAISTHSTMDAQFSAGSVYSGKNIIQIWNLGDLNHKVGAKNSPALAYAIAHDGGTAWCLEWCPSGCYQSDDVLPKESKGDNSKRMGLLAAACSDGCVRVYSLVFPEDLPSSRENYKIDEDCNTTYPIYKTEPALLLVVNRKMYENKQQTWQVTKLSWTKENNHNVVVAGFSNGYVALWDLSTKSPLLKSKKGNTVFLNPYRHFLAHHHVVTMVYIIPQDKKRFLATASLDRYYKFWDLEDTNNPRNISKKSYVTDGTFLNHWCCALITYDDALSMNHNYAYCLPLREYTYKYYNILPTNSSSYTIDTSDFGNSIANGTLAGEILAMFPQQLIYIRDMDKTLPRKRYISMISSLEVVDFDTTSKDGKLLMTDKDELKNEKIFMPSTYNESKDRFGIKFLDKMNSFREDNFKANPKGSRKTLTCDMMQGVPIEQYPFMSANRVSWNPNAWSFLWLAAGYQNGFVRLTSFKSLASTVEWSKLLASHIETLKCENSTTTL